MYLNTKFFFSLLLRVQIWHGSYTRLSEQQKNHSPPAMNLGTQPHSNAFWDLTSQQCILGLDPTAMHLGTQIPYVATYVCFKLVAPTGLWKRKHHHFLNWGSSALFQPRESNPCPEVFLPSGSCTPPLSFLLRDDGLVEPYLWPTTCDLTPTWKNRTVSFASRDQVGRGALLFSKHPSSSFSIFFSASFTLFRSTGHFTRYPDDWIYLQFWFVTKDLCQRAKTVK